MGSAETGAEILDAAARVKAANPKARYCCDPVIGDVGRDIYVRPGIPEFMRDHAVPAADVVTPNQFELDYLSGRATETMRDALAAIDALHALGPKAILVTSLHTQETPADAIDLVASDASGHFRVRTPKLPISINGAGDAIAALFFAHYLRSGSVAEAVSRAASSVFGVLKRTADANAREILLVDAQDEFVKPGRVFAAEKL
jgi:pyridoxine kinase